MNEPFTMTMANGYAYRLTLQRGNEERLPRFILDHGVLFERVADRDYRQVMDYDFWNLPAEQEKP